MAPDFTTGEMFGAYRLGPVLGRGGMGVVYRAEHVHLGRTVALKLLAPQLSRNQEFRARFLRESRLAAAVDHPNIVTVYDAGEHAGTLYLAMRFVEGTDLGQLLARSGPLPPARALDLLDQVGGALDAAHASGLVHRDVKPGNIMVEGDRCYLTDFGLTKQTIAATSSLTATGVFLGTPDYAAPEQVEGRAVDARTDVYALAAVLHECLTGSKPFPRDTPVAVMYAQLQEAPPRASSLRPDLPSVLDAVVARGMAKRPEERPGSCTELLSAARRTLATEAKDDRPTAVLPASTPPSEPVETSRRVPPPRARRRLPVLAAAALVAVLVAVGLGLAVAGGGDDEAAQDDPPATDRSDGSPPSEPRVARRALSVGRRPFGVQLAEGALWAANNSDGTVSRVEPRGGESTEIDVGEGPFGLAAADGAIWVANSDSDDVTRIDARSGAAAPPVEVGPSPFFLAVDDDRLYVSNGGGNTVSVLDAGTGERVRNPIEVGREPRGIAAAPDGVWVASRADGTVSRIADGGVDTVRVGRNPVGVAYGGGAVWVANKESDTVSRIEVGASEPRATATRVGREPFGVAFGAGQVWVTNSADDTVVRLDPDSGDVIGDPIEVPDQPVGVTVGGGSVWVSRNDAGSVTRIAP